MARGRRGGRVRGKGEREIPAVWEPLFERITVAGDRHVRLLQDELLELGKGARGTVTFTAVFEASGEDGVDLEVVASSRLPRTKLPAVKLTWEGSQLVLPLSAGPNAYGDGAGAEED